METRRIQFFSDEMKEQLAAGEARGAELKRRNEEETVRKLAPEKVFFCLC